MSLTPFPIDQFRGLQLGKDPSEVGSAACVDCSNVDFDREGRVRSRDGTAAFNAVAHSAFVTDVFPFYISADKLMVADTAPKIHVYSSAGVLATSSATGARDYTGFARIGTPTSERVYAVNSTIGEALRWNGTAFAYVAAIPSAAFLAVQPKENRLVAANVLGSSTSRVQFSNAGDAETWGANDYVTLDPGDGSEITGMASWGNELYVFKRGAFYVFYGNSTSGTGQPIFNYRKVETPAGGPRRGRAVVAGNEGVYFAGDYGLYVTSGGTPRRVTTALDPLFKGDPTYAFTGEQIGLTPAGNWRLGYSQDRLFFTYWNPGATARGMLVYRPSTGDWTYWTGGAAQVVDMGGTTIYHTFTSPATTIYKLSGTLALASHFQSGFYELVPGREAFTRWTRPTGTGAPTFDLYTDYASSDPLSRGGSVTLGTSPAITQGYHLKAYQGRFFSHKLSATTGAWAVNRLQHDIAHAR